MSRSENKSARLLQLEAMLLAYPEGLSPAEIARRLDVNRSTIGRDLSDLPKHVYVDDLDGGKWKIDRQAYLVNVRFDLHEAMAVHLATRLLATRMDRQNPSAASALRKLGIAMEKLAPQISRHLQQSAEEMDDPERRHDAAYLAALRDLTRGWAEQKKVIVVYPGNAGMINEYLFAPYFIEPYAIGQTTYVFGLREPPGQIRTFKIERIVGVKLTDEKYVIPSNFDPHELLGDAWGIWFTDEEPVDVQLRFTAKVRERVLQTRWHKSERTEEAPDGSVLWTARIAAPQEMMPWIRSWGSDVEVLRPETLRSEIAAQIADLYRVYHP